MRLRADPIIFVAAVLMWTGSQVTHWELIGSSDQAECQKKVEEMTKPGDHIEPCTAMNLSDFEFIKKHAKNIVWERE